MPDRLSGSIILQLLRENFQWLNSNNSSDDLVTALDFTKLVTLLSSNNNIGISKSYNEFRCGRTGPCKPNCTRLQMDFNCQTFPSEVKYLRFPTRSQPLVNENLSLFFWMCAFLLGLISNKKRDIRYRSAECTSNIEYGNHLKGRRILRFVQEKEIFVEIRTSKKIRWQVLNELRQYKQTIIVIFKQIPY